MYVPGQEDVWAPARYWTKNKQDVKVNIGIFYIIMCGTKSIFTTDKGWLGYS